MSGLHGNPVRGRKVFARLAFLSFVLLLRATASDETADDPQPPPPPKPNQIPSWVSTPVLPHDSLASSTYLQSHPELAQSSASSSPEPPAVDTTPPPSQPSVAPTSPPTVTPSVPSQPQQNLSLNQSAPPAADTTPSPPVSPLKEFVPPPPDANDGPEELGLHLLVVYNTNDPDSKDLAQYYAQRRQIPDERVLGISCSRFEEIGRKEFDDSIREPIISYLCLKGWLKLVRQTAHYGDRTLDIIATTHNSIWAIVLIRGVPLKIAHDPNHFGGMEKEPELESNGAAVDSELALLPIIGLPLGGFVPNPFYDADATGQLRIGSQLARRIVLVTRLDGPKPADVRRMIDDSIAAEKNRLAGYAVIDTRGFTDAKNGYTIGDVWMRDARTMLVQDGWSVDFDDRPETIPATDTCNQVAYYLGWYTEHANGPWVTPPSRFVPGAIAYHLHSSSAATLRSDKVNWVGPLISRGVAATMGAVYEPYLVLTPNLATFTKRLLLGQSFAEAAYASQRGVSWMITVVGDPLYRPFAKPLDAALAQAGTMHTTHDDWLLLQKLKKSLLLNEVPDTTATLEQYLDTPATGPVAHEVLGDLLQRSKDPSASADAEKAYRRAWALDTMPIDRIRLGLKLAIYYMKQGRNDQALIELKRLHQMYPEDATRFGVAENPALPGRTGNTPGPVIAPAPQPPQAPKAPPVTPAKPAQPAIE